MSGVCNGVNTKKGLLEVNGEGVEEFDAEGFKVEGVEGREWSRSKCLKLDSETEVDAGVNK